MLSTKLRKVNTSGLVPKTVKTFDQKFFTSTLERKLSSFDIKTPRVALQSVETLLLEVQLIGRLLTQVYVGKN